ncbi:RNA polymerase II large subunit CTD [Penicillium atrosanguineum]|nr:RNA polymerase II large subunit CTD [Penicillium atrosanguineum]
MVVEEPDIEIGAVVSSKAISRRIATVTGVPAYGFNFARMSMLPPGFMMGAQAGKMPGQQPPPPGRGN